MTLQNMILLMCGRGWMRWMVLMAMLLIGSGCLTIPGRTGRARGDGSIPAVIREFSDGLIDARDHIVTIAVLLDQVEPSTGMVPPALRDTLISEIGATDLRAQSLKALGEEISAKGDAYFAQWEEQLRLVRNPAMVARADLRKEQVVQCGRQVGAALDVVREKATPFGENLRLYEAFLQGRPVAGSPSTETLIAELKSDASLLSDRLERALGTITEMLRTVFPGSEPI